jgi:hypothetical protein
MRNQVTLFKVFSAELGDPNKLLFVAKLSNPVLFGVRIRISDIKLRFNIIQIIFNINFFDN